MWSYGIQEVANLKTIWDQELKNKIKDVAEQPWLTFFKFVWFNL